MIKRLFLNISTVLLLINTLSAESAELLDRIVAIAENDVILESELQAETSMVLQKIQASNMMMPPSFVLRKQVVDKLVMDSLQRQLAERAGINISEEMLNLSVADIAQRNNMGVEEFKAELVRQGMDYDKFYENMRNEIIISQLRAREIGSRVKVTDREVEHFLETQGQVGDEVIKYHLGHILLALPDQATSSEIQEANKKAGGLVEKLRQGEDFKQMAVAHSQGAQALEGGDLGWRTMAEVPTLFADQVTKLDEGDVAEPIHSPSGIHIIKMLELKGLKKHMVVKTRARHILIKTNELINDEEAQKRLNKLKARIIDGDAFESLARSHSDDKGSAIKGGELGWVQPGVLVPPFESAMNALAINEISDPVQTQFGWHLIQVLERDKQDNSSEYRKNQVRDIIRQRKIEEETELWLRRLHDEAYIEVFLDRL